jgi:biopolymer transport protein ExbD
VGIRVFSGVGQFDLGNKKSANVNINLIPFVDLMTCLTAFLLVTAVWSSQAQMKADISDGHSRANTEPCHLSVLVTRTGLHVAPTRGEHLVLGTRDWSGLRETLKSDHGATCGTPDGVEIAGASNVDYDAIVTAMDAARGAGYHNIMVKTPEKLSASFTL